MQQKRWHTMLSTISVKVISRKLMHRLAGGRVFWHDLEPTESCAEIFEEFTYLYTSKMNFWLCIVEIKTDWHSYVHLFTLANARISIMKEFLRSLLTTSSWLTTLRTTKERKNHGCKGRPSSQEFITSDSYIWRKGETTPLTYQL